MVSTGAVNYDKRTTVIEAFNRCTEADKKWLLEQFAINTGYSVILGPALPNYTETMQDPGHSGIDLGLNARQGVALNEARKEAQMWKDRCEKMFWLLPGDTKIGDIK